MLGRPWSIDHNMSRLGCLGLWAGAVGAVGAEGANYDEIPLQYSATVQAFIDSSIHIICNYLAISATRAHGKYRVFEFRFRAGVSITKAETAAEIVLCQSHFYTLPQRIRPAGQWNGGGILSRDCTRGHSSDCGKCRCAPLPPSPPTKW